MVRTILPLIVTVITCLASARAGEADGTVLDTGSSYWRYHLTFRPPTFNPPVKNRRGKVYKHLGYFRGWHVPPMRGRVRSADAPADWVKPDFDDGAWARDKGYPGHGNSEYEPVVRVKRLRSYFVVPAPAGVSGMNLDIEYIGGVAVWLNGKEVGRGHLPAGKLTADVLATSYSQEAYEWQIPSAKTGYPMWCGQWKPPSNPKARRWRKLVLKLEPKLLRKGGNVLAVAVHQSGHGAGALSWDGNRMGRRKIKGRAAVSAEEAAGRATEGVAEKGSKIYRLAWPHGMVRKLKLTASPPGSAKRPARPAGVHISAEDIHRRVVNRDFFPAASRPIILRMVGARNGTYSAQAVVETSSALGGFSAKASDLVKTGGDRKIPASAVRVRYGGRLALEPNLVNSRFDRHNSHYNNTANSILARYSKVQFKNKRERVRPPKHIMDEARAIAIFDHLADGPPASVPANTCQTVWVSVRIPKGTPAGEYRGTLTLNTGSAKTAELRLYVMDWKLPESKDYVSFVGLQQSLWGACARYKVPAWSDAHWKHLERVARLLAEVGNDVAVLPLVTGGEAGNAESLVPWTKKGSGYDYDWKNLDRYLELVAKHWGKNTAVVGEVCWVPRTSKGWTVINKGVTVRGGGKDGQLAMPAFGSAEWKKLFVPFAKAVAARVKAKGFKSFHWGWFYDGVPGQLAAGSAALAEACPDVSWARASHNGTSPTRPFAADSKALVKLDMHIRRFPCSFDKAGEPQSRYGWKQRGNVLFPRVASEIQAIDRIDSPMAFRWITENALVNGASGFGRIGADFWPPFLFANWYHPFESYILCAGPQGADSSARFEALREGVQEAEVRIWLEKSGKDKAEPAKTVLANRIRTVGALVTGSPSSIGAYYPDWQQRSWALYAAAAAAGGGRAPSAAEKKKFFGGK
jgi:Glycoside hydrolase 123, catalytic domain/Glycoside hydrolase 123 N-terminal domain